VRSVWAAGDERASRAAPFVIRRLARAPAAGTSARPRRDPPGASGPPDVRPSRLQPSMRADGCLVTGSPHVAGIVVDLVGETADVPNDAEARLAEGDHIERGDAILGLVGGATAPTAQSCTGTSFDADSPHPRGTSETWPGQGERRESLIEPAWGRPCRGVHDQRPCPTRTLLAQSVPEAAERPGRPGAPERGRVAACPERARSHRRLASARPDRCLVAARRSVRG
jgi:hypothetical protein